MKKIAITILLVLLLPCMTLAHSGGTDASGGHYNRSTGKYHYHHGYEAHQHPDGICPYNYKDNTKPSSVKSSIHNKNKLAKQETDNRESFFDRYPAFWTIGILLLMNIVFWVFIAIITHL